MEMFQDTNRMNQVLHHLQPRPHLNPCIVQDLVVNRLLHRPNRHHLNQDNQKSRPGMTYHTHQCNHHLLIRFHYLQIRLNPCLPIEYARMGRHRYCYRNYLNQNPAILWDPAEIHHPNRTSHPRLYPSTQ